MIAANKLSGWRGRLAVVLSTNETKEFSWGENDCFMGIVVPAVEAMIGIDIGAEYRGSYDSEESAITALARFGFADLVDLVASKFPEVPPALAQVGDIAVIPHEGAGGFGGTLGIVTGERIISLVPTGRATVKLMRASRAFRVG